MEKIIVKKVRTRCTNANCGRIAWVADFLAEKRIFCRFCGWGAVKQPQPKKPKVKTSPEPKEPKLKLTKPATQAIRCKGCGGRFFAKDGFGNCNIALHLLESTSCKQYYEKQGYQIFYENNLVKLIRNDKETQKEKRLSRRL